MSAAGSGSGGEQGEGDGPPRPIRDIQGLLRYCVQNTETENPPEEAEEIRNLLMSPERKVWLEEALKSMSVDVIKEMLDNITSIKNQLNTLNSSSRVEAECDEAIEITINSIENLMERIQDLDMAADFHKIGGYDIIPPLLTSPYSQLKMKGAELVAELVQNHDYCQKAAVDMNILDTLLDDLNSESLSDKVKVKSLYAVSCLIRNNKYSQNVFESKNGYSALFRVMQSTSEDGPKLRTKSSFLLSSLIQLTPDIKDNLFQMGFIDQFVALLHFNHDESHEHLLSALLNFVSEFESGLVECRRPELQLRSLLQNRIILLNKKPEFQEEESYCNQLLDLCFTQNNDVPESER